MTKPRVLAPLEWLKDASPLVSAEAGNALRKGSDGKLFAEKGTGGGGGLFPGAPSENQIITGWIGGNLLSHLYGDIGYAEDLTVSLKPGVYQVTNITDTNGSILCGSDLDGLPANGNYRLVLSEWFTAPEPNEVIDALVAHGSGPQCVGIPVQEQILYDFGAGRMYVRSAYKYDVSLIPESDYGSEVRTLHTPWKRLGSGGTGAGGPLEEIDRRYQTGFWTVEGLTPYAPAYLFFYTETPIEFGGQNSAFALLGAIDGVAHIPNYDPNSPEPIAEAFVLGWISTGMLTFQTFFVPTSDTVTFALAMSSDATGNNPPGNGVDYVAIMQ